MKKKITVEVEIKYDGEYCKDTCLFQCIKYCIGFNKELNYANIHPNDLTYMRCKPCLRITGDL